MAITQDADLFSFELPNNGCYTRHNASVSARMFDCQVATNAGFFSFGGGCVGDVIVNKKVVSWSGEAKAAFGILPNKTTLVGYVNNNEDFLFKSMLSGNGWLVRNGQSYVRHSKEFAPSGNNSFVRLKAPRTAVGIMKDGSIFTSVVDGIEVNHTGLDLWEYAEILIEQGAVQAINLDGGGSTDAVLDGKVWSVPTCTDYEKPICERPVTTITCIKYPQKEEELFLAQ
ncbi:hypothetical protein FGO68_gene16467 [Halteria grandinella]|uniref:Phosphodiester glycosidase domain-containing protein n=1 Tax=Halteria grandinella TaxID=5974 RepID=A0A8J8NKY8_HALGN|nr:hypothetical protein FGO68_gene16467 [Halteria grandinella]